MTKPTTKTTTQTTTPWEGAVPSINTILQQAGKLYSGSAGTTAPLSAQSQAVLNQMFRLSQQPNANLAAGNTAAQQLMTGTGTGGDVLSATARGDNLKTVNPYLEQQIGDQSDKIATQLRSIYSSGGRYGSATMNRDLTDRLGALRGGILSTNWENERNRQLNAAQQLQSGQVAGIGSLSGLDDIKWNPAAQLMKAGSYLDTYNQSKSDNPWTRLANYGNIVGGVTSGTGTTTEKSPGPSILAQILGGLTGIGSLAGSLKGAGILSDERAKEDIKKVGKTDGGSNIYTYRYKSGGPMHMGVMAQEEARRNPSAVLRRPDGLLSVDYAQVA